MRRPLTSGEAAPHFLDSGVSKDGRSEDAGEEAACIHSVEFNVARLSGVEERKLQPELC